MIYITDAMEAKVTMATKVTDRSNVDDYAYAYGGLHRAVEMFLDGAITREGLAQFELDIEAELRGSDRE